MFNELLQLIGKYEGYIVGIGDLGVEAVELLLVRDKIESYLTQESTPIPPKFLARVMELDILLKKKMDTLVSEFSSEEMTHFQKTVQKPLTHWWWHICLSPFQVFVPKGCGGQ